MDAFDMSFGCLWIASFASPSLVIFPSTGTAQKLDVALELLHRDEIFEHSCLKSGLASQVPRSAGSHQTQSPRRVCLLSLPMG